MMIVFSHKFGQLGNRLFGFAHLIGNAAANNTTVVNLSFDEYARFFVSTSRDVFCRYPPVNGFSRSSFLRSAFFLINRAILKLLRKLKLLKSSAHLIIIADLPEYQFYDQKYYELASEDFYKEVKCTPFIFLFGRFFRDYVNFENHKDIIRQYFRPILEIQNNIDRLVKSARQNSSLVIGVHIRRGDYAQFAQGRYYYTPQQYAEKMDTLQQSLGEKTVSYVICSNEKIGLDIFGNLNVVFANGGPVEDMYSLAACDLIMGPPSTFSAWAAFYGDKPLYQIRDISKVVEIQDFVKLPPQVLYNF